MIRSSLILKELEGLKNFGKTKYSIINLKSYNHGRKERN